MSLVHYTCFIVFLSLAGYILYKNSRSRVNISVCLLMLGFALWALSLTFISNQDVPDHVANIFLDIGTVAISFYGVFTFLSLGFFSKRLKPSILLYGLLGMYLVAMLVYQVGWEFAYFSPGRIHSRGEIMYNNIFVLTLVNIFHNGLVITGFVMIILFYRQTGDRLVKRQIRIIIITAMIAYFLASFNVYASKLIPFIEMPLLVDVFMLIMAVGLIYSIVKYELFEITPSLVANQIIDFLPTGLLITNEEHEIVRVNKSLGEISGKDKGFFLHKPLNSIFKSLTGGGVADIGYQDCQFQFNLLSSKGEGRAMILNHKILKDDFDRVIGFVAMISDVDLLIRTQKELERLNESLEEKVHERTLELLKAKEQAEEGERLKTAFLQNISHEIRTPLNAICGFSDFLTSPGITDDKKIEYNKIVQNSSDQLLSIVTDILTVSALETNQEKVKYEKMNVNSFLKEMFLVFNQQVKDGVTLGLSNNIHEEDAWVLTDRTKLNQVLSNLLVNAIKFTRKGNIEFGCKLERDELVFFVKDDGIGIKEEMQGKIFDRFRQEDARIEKDYGGTGLGLSISKGFVELLGGKIWVESEKGKGARFWFTIPCFRSKPGGVANIPSTSIKLDKTIIVAEDEEFNYLYIKELLIGTGITLLHARNGMEAIDLFERNPAVELILMDIKMPGMDGVSAATEIKGKYQHVKIIAQTAYALETEVEMYKEVFDDYITKPIKGELLIEKIVQTIGTAG